MRFHCQSGCVRCCQQKGHVYLTREDIARLAAYLGLSRAEFRRQYLCGEPPLLRFRKQRHKQCPFLLADGCSVHPAKPLQCSSFPFWPEILENEAERRKTAVYCPGLNQGPLVNLTLAREISGRVREAFPVLYEVDAEEPESRRPAGCEPLQNGTKQKPDARRRAGMRVCRAINS